MSLVSPIWSVRIVASATGWRACERHNDADFICTDSGLLSVAALLAPNLLPVAPAQ